MCLAQGLNTVPPVRLEPIALRSPTKHSRYHYVTAIPNELQWGFISVCNYRTHQDNVGYLVEVNVQYGIRVYWERERERERESSKPARKVLHCYPRRILHAQPS